MKRIGALLAALIAVLVIGGTFFTVDETEQALIIQFGRILRVEKTPGLHWKIPFVQTVTKYEKRILNVDAAPAEFLTQDKKKLVVDSYARWSITDPEVFFQTLKAMPIANARLDNIISSTLREQVASHDLSDIITEKREPIMDQVTTDTNEKSQEFGVTILDVRIKRTDFPRETAESIYARMRAERDRISKRYRSEGAEEQLNIKAETDKEKAIIIAEAKRQSEELRGEGDAEAIRIYAGALQQDPEFYTFLRSLQVYRDSLGEDSRLILASDSPLFQYLEGPQPRKRKR